MNPRVKAVKANNDHTLTITFANGEHRLFDMKPYLDKGVFRELKDLSYFRSVHPILGTVAWPHEQDLCPDTLYEGSSPIRGRATRSRNSGSPRRRDSSGRSRNKAS